MTGTRFRDEQRAGAARWKQRTTTLPVAARQAAPYVGKDGRTGTVPYEFCLPAAYASHNLLPSVRQPALELFRELGIPWHAGVGDGPGNHLLSSQVQCVNALMAMVTGGDKNQAAGAAALGFIRLRSTPDLGP